MSTSTAAPEQQVNIDVESRNTELAALIDILADAVAQDGGLLELVDVDHDTGVVTVELSGACSSCAISGATLTQGVKRILLERLTWVTDVHGRVDDTIDAEISAAMGRGSYQPI